MSQFHRKTADVARGKWSGILQHFGIPAASLKNKHGQCPLCQSKDGFRWDNREGGGSYICKCGSGDGFALAMAYTGKTFTDIANDIDQIVGNMVGDGPARMPQTKEQRYNMLRDTWHATKPVAIGDTVNKYLDHRGIGGELAYPEALRFAPNLPDGDGGTYPAMVAMIGLPGDKFENGRQKFVSMHKTFLRRDGLGKAEIASPRRMMPGTLPEGSCVMLGDYVPGGPLGIAEGIETALSASALFNMPVWAALNSSMLAKWVAPAGCEEVAIFSDNDAKFGGQAASYKLAHRLAVKGIEASVHIPKVTGEDWNDVYLREGQ